jgi:hypothetical protein
MILKMKCKKRLRSECYGTIDKEEDIKKSMEKAINTNICLIKFFQV